MAESSSPINDSAMAESSSPINDSPMAESSSLINDIEMAESFSPINDEIRLLFGREKPSHKVSGSAAGVFLWRIMKIWADLLVLPTVCFMMLGYRLLGLICHLIATVLYLGPAATNFINKTAPHVSEAIKRVFAILRKISRGMVEINTGFAEINRCVAEINRGFAEIKKGVAVLRGIASGRRLQKFIITFILTYICILCFSSPPHIPQVSIPPQVSITKDLILNITVYLRDNGGFVVRREFVCHIAIVLR